MEILRTGCSFPFNILLSTAVLVIVQTIPCKAQVVFGPDDPDNNEVIYLGEDLTLRCEVLGVISDDSVQFIILKDETALIVNNVATNLFEGRNIQASPGSITFVLQTLVSENGGTYECIAMSPMNNYGGKTYTLQLQQAGTVQCQRNVTGTYISMEVVLLTCYFTPSEGKIVKWFKNDTSGMTELTSTTVRVNNIKHMVLSVIQPSDELNLSNYVCGESQDISAGMMADQTRSCNVSSFLVFNDAFIFVSPKLSSIPPGSSINLTCNIVTLPSGTVAVVFWQLPPAATLPVGFEATTHESYILRIQVSAEAEVGSVIPFTCNAFIGMIQFSRDFSITINAHEPASSTTLKPSNINPSPTKNTTQNNDANNSNNNINDIFIIIIIFSLVAIVVTASLIFVVCLCLCRKKQGSEFAREDEKMETREIADESSSFPAHGKINKKNRDISGVENEIDASLEEDDDEDRDYNLVNLPIKHNSGSPGMSANIVNQNRGVDENYSGLRLNSPDDGRPMSVLYSTVNKQLHHDQEYY